MKFFANGSRLDLRLMNFTRNGLDAGTRPATPGAGVLPISNNSGRGSFGDVRLNALKQYNPFNL
jgi:hypothetical protein